MQRSHLSRRLPCSHLALLAGIGRVKSLPEPVQNVSAHKSERLTRGKRVTASFYQALVSQGQEDENSPDFDPRIGQTIKNPLSERVFVVPRDRFELSTP
jgi:hypothetical protein